MDASTNQHLGEKSQSKHSGGTNSKSPRTRESSRSRSRPGNNGQQSSSEIDRGKQSKQSRYNERSWEKNKNKFNRPYNKAWNRNQQSKRGNRWDQRPSTYGNRSWHRNNSNQSNQSNQHQYLDFTDYFVRQLSENLDAQQFDTDEGFNSRFNNSFENRHQEFEGKQTVEGEREGENSQENDRPGSKNRNRERKDKETSNYSSSQKNSSGRHRRPPENIRSRKSSNEPSRQRTYDFNCTDRRSTRSRFETRAKQRPDSEARRDDARSEEHSKAIIDEVRSEEPPNPNQGDKVRSEEPPNPNQGDKVRSEEPPNPNQGALNDLAYLNDGSSIYEGGKGLLKLTEIRTRTVRLIQQEHSDKIQGVLSELAKKINSTFPQKQQSSEEINDTSVCNNLNQVVPIPEQNTAINELLRLSESEDPYNQNQAPLDDYPWPNDLISFNPDTSFIKSEVDSPVIDDFILNIKPEPQDASDLEFDCLRVAIDKNFPSISVVPISKLIKSELADLNCSDIIAASTSARGRPTLRPNLIKRRKKSINEGSSLSENLVQRVANMDKVGIKNVINNSGTKYDAALKIQARKRLREEIRKQLKSINFKSHDNSENSVIVPDEIVDSMNIPAVVLDEIRKVFGIVLVEDMNVIQEKADSESVTLPPGDDSPPPLMATQHKSTEGSSKSPDLMSRLKMLEEVKSHEKVSPVRTAVVTQKQHSNEKTNNDVVVIDSSSSSSSSSSSGSDSDSSSSTSSNTSTTSSYKRRRRKKRILEANVVGNFEKLILPNLSESQRRRYRNKYSNSTKGSLLYIYGVCVSRANQNSTSIDPKEKLKLKRNLSSADNAQSLEFLMRAILNLFEQQKEKRRKDKEKPSATIARPETKSKSTCNQGSSGEDDGEHVGSALRSELLKQTRRKEKQNTSVSTKLSPNQKNPSNPLSSTKQRTDSTCNQVSTGDDDEVHSESANSSSRAELLQHQSTKVDKAAPTTTENLMLESNSDSDVYESIDGNPPSCRQWKSPGEKKCIEIESAPSSSLSTFGLMPPPLGVQSLDLESLKSHSLIGNEAVNSIREIDVKLMELHKRKMYIEEMILKLQKDKMDVDLRTMKLQNEKFILLNSALATATTAANSKVEKKPKSTTKRKPFSTPFSEKLRNRKKRCQRDILLEDTDSAINAKKPLEDTSDLAKLMLLPRQTRRSIRVSGNQNSTTTMETIPSTASSSETTKTDTEVKEEDAFKEEAIVKLKQFDYTDVPNGSLDGWKLPITQIIVAGESIVAASEDGNIYKFNIRTRELESKFSKHTEAITQIFTCPRENFVYTTSLDGFMKKTSIENFGLEIQSLNLQEPLQSIDIQWGIAFIGSRWGNIFTYNIKNNNLSESLLCSSGSSIIAIKATKEGPRKILIVSSRGNQINFRDAMTGLLLRSLDVPENLHVYSILLDDSYIFCGTQRNEIHQFNFTTGNRIAIFQCGNGAVSMKLYKEKYIFVGCYDGFVYVLDKTDGCQIGRFPGSGKMILALEIAGDKLITSAKDNTMQIIDIPKYIVTKDKG